MSEGSNHHFGPIETESVDSIPVTFVETGLVFDDPDEDETEPRTRPMPEEDDD